jgi:CDP-glucose 4,6-dehydratase
VGDLGARVSRALVTGGYGLVGGWLVEALLARGDEVTVLRHRPSPRSLLVLSGHEAACTVVDGDVLDGGLVERMLAGGVDTVFHLAAQPIVAAANRSPAATFEVNVRGTWTLLEACRAAGTERIVVASSDKVYGASEDQPYGEDHVLEARYPYDVSKVCVDHIARSYWQTYGVPVAVTRFTNTYGGGDRNASRLVPEAVRAVLAGRAPVIRSDGTPVRDYLHAQDAAAGYLAVADALASADGGARGEAFNGGTDDPHSVLDVVAMVCRLAGSDLAPDVRGTGTPEGELGRVWVDSTKLRETTGWRPQVGLEDGLRRTIDWYREHPGALEG